MDEALQIEVRAVHDVARQLAAEGASLTEWRRYREWRDAVISADHATEPAAV